MNILEDNVSCNFSIEIYILPLFLRNFDSKMEKKNVFFKAAHASAGT